MWPSKKLHRSLPLLLPPFSNDLKADKNSMTEPPCQKRSFLSHTLPTQESLKIIVPQTLGKTRFDFVTFLANAGQADIGARCSIWKFGLFAAVRCTMRQGPVVKFSPTVTLGSGSCDAQQVGGSSGGSNTPHYDIRLSKQLLNYKKWRTEEDSNPRPPDS